MRYTFGGGVADFAIAAPSSNASTVKALGNLTGGTAWSAAIGGTQYTDILATGTDPAPITTDLNGFVRPFQGPDGVQRLWVDFGAGHRRLMIPQEVATTVAAADATTTTKGSVQLAGDLDGTAAAPTVPGLASKVSTSDPRLSDARTPTAHAASHASGGSDAIALSALGVPTSAVSMNGKKLTNLATPVANTDAATKAYVDAGVPGAWTTYTPTLSLVSGGTAPTLGNSTLTGAYIQIGKTVFFRVQFTAGSTFVAGSGNYGFSLPPIAQKNPWYYGPLGGTGIGNAGGTTVPYLLMQSQNNTTNVCAQIATSINACLGGSGINGTAWASGHTFFAQGSYEGA